MAQQPNTAYDPESGKKSGGFNFNFSKRIRALNKNGFNSSDKDAAQASGSRSSVDTAQSDLAAQESSAAAGGFYSASGRLGLSSIPSRGVWRYGITKKRALFGGVTIGVIGAVMGITSILQGPGQLVTLSEVLSKPQSGSEDASRSRMQGLFRFARTGDFGETRLGKLGSKSYGKSINRLKAIGVEFKTNGINFTGAKIDSKKLASNFPELKKMNDAQVRVFLADKLAIPPETITVRGGVADIDGRNLSDKVSRSFMKDTRGLLGDGKVVNWLKFRPMSKALGVPSLFHYWERATNKVINSLLDREAKQRAAEERKEKSKEVRKPSQERAASSTEKIKGKLSGPQTALGGALIFTTALCTVRSVADDVVVVNRSSVVEPAMAEAVMNMSMGSQIKSGKDFDLSQVGAAVDSFTDKDGKTIWESKELQAMSGERSPTGKTLPAEYRQAFSNDTTAQHIKDTVGSPTLPGGIDLGAAACSTPGIIIQGAAGVVLVVGSIAAAGPTSGASLAAIAVKTGAGMAATAGALYFIETFAVKMLADEDLLPEQLSGPLGGSLLAYAARESANTSVRSSGGVALSKEDEASYAIRAEQRSREEFQSKSIFARLFDTKDYRSATSRFASSLHPSLAANVASATNSFVNAGSSLPRVFSSLIPNATAASGTNIDWGFPAFGIPLSVLNDPNLADPYANADVLAQVLAKDDSTSDKLKDRAARCFGVDLTESADGWDVIIKDDPVNPNSEDYLKGDCDNLDDYNWRRTILFVFDTNTIKAVSCYDGDDAACSDLSVNTGGSSGSSSSAEVSGDAQSLAQEILENDNIDISASNFCRYCEEDIKNTADGKPAYGNVTLDINILKFLVDAGKQMKVDVNSITGEGCGHASNTCKSAGGRSMHYEGKAVDLGCNGFDEGKMDEIGAKYGIKPYTAERCSNNNHAHYSTNGT